MNTVFQKPSEPVAVVGGGLTGLALAAALHAEGVPVVLLERAIVFGGHVRSTRERGFLVEHGPHTLLLPRRQPWPLLEKIGVADKIQLPETAAKKRYLVRGGKPHAMPSSLFGFLKTPLFSPSAKLRVLAEPLMPRARDIDETVATFVSRRLGREFLDYALDPFVGGVYAGNPRELCLRWAFPRMKALEDRYRSLVWGAVRRKIAALGDKNAWKTKTFSFPDGLQTLTDALLAAIPREAAVAGADIRAIEQRADGGWTLRFVQNGAMQTVQASRLALAVPADALCALPLPETLRARLAPLRGVASAPVAVWHQGYRREDVAHPLDGFGMLVPSREPFEILGTLFTSSTFAGRAPDGHVLLTTYVGGRRRPDLAYADEAAQARIVARDLKALLGVRGKPVFERRFVYEHAIAQYRANHAEFLEACADAQAHAPNLFLCGNYRDGIAAYAALARGLDFSRAIRKTFEA